MNQKTNPIVLSVAQCRKAYDEAYAAIMEAEESEHEEVNRMVAKRAATDAALANLPMLTSRQGAAEYIACIAWMQGRRLLTPAEVRSHMYTAQTILATMSGGNSASK